MLRKVFVIIFYLIVTIGAVSWGFSQSHWGQKKLKIYAEKAFSDSFQAKAKIGSIDLVFPFFLKFRDIEIVKDHSFIRVDSFSCTPFWLDLPFNRLTLISAGGQGIEIGGSNPEELLETSSLPSPSLSIWHLSLQSLHITHDKIPGGAFDGSLRGHVYLSSTLDSVKVSAKVTRAMPSVWPKQMKIRLVKQDNLYQCSGSLFLEGITTPSLSLFGPDDKVAWNFSAKRAKDLLEEVRGEWKVECPTTEQPLLKNFVLNRALKAKGSFFYRPEKEFLFSCDDLNLSMVFGKNIRVQTDVEGAGTTLMQYGEPLVIQAKMSLENLSYNGSQGSIQFLAPTFSCNTYHGSLEGFFTFLYQDGVLDLSSKADGKLLSDGVEIPIHYVSELNLGNETSSFSSDLVVSPFSLSNKIEKFFDRTKTWSSFRCQDLGILQKYLPLSIGGSGELTLSSTHSDTEHLMHFSSHATDAFFGPLSCVSADFSLSSEDLLKKIDASLDISSCKVGGLILDKTESHFSLDPKNFTFSMPHFHLIGKAAALPFDLTGAGEGKFDEIQSYLTLTELTGTLLEEKIRLEAPIKLECLDFEEMLSQALFSFRIGDQGSLQGQWIHPSPSRSTLELSWRDLPFSLMAALTGISSADGIMSGECHYNTTPRDAVGSFQMQAKVSRCGALGSPDGSLQIDTSLSLANTNVTGDLTVEGTGIVEPIKCSFTLPVKRLLKTPFVTLSHTSPFKATLQGKAQISKLFYYWMPEEIGCEAILSCNNQFSGSLEDISVRGPVSLREGRMELLATGQVLENIEMDGEMHHRTLTMNSIRATDTLEGSLTGHGLMNFFEEGTFSWKLFLSCTNLEVVNLPYTSASADAALELDGTATSLLISGHGTAKKAFVDVAARFPKNIPELNVTFCGEKKAETPPFLVSFDLYLEAPSGGVIRGRGLHTDWRGHAHLGGPVTKLNLTGLIECTKGTFTLAGKELTISHGTISVAGNIFRDSRLNVLANVTLPSITAQVGLKGSLKDPKFFIQSTPILPEKEVLALLLFNKEYSDISPLESLQIANAALSLQQTSGPFDLIDKVKSTLGIDLIDISSSQFAPGQPAPWSTLGADSEDAEGPLPAPQNDVTLKVGKYISNGVAITVSKDVTAGVNRVGFEASLSQHVTAEAEIGDDAGGIASLKWKKDY